MNEVGRYDVVIIGFGPTGATLAHLLGLSGVRVLVLERERAGCQLPRAVHFDEEVMRVFQTIGIADEVASAAIVNPGMRFVDADGRLLLDWSRPQHVGRHGWNASYRFHQPDLEAILDARIASHPTVTLRRRCEAFMLEDHGDAVNVRFEDMATGEIQMVSAAHVVGCDGARSLVRRFIGSGMIDHGFHEQWLVVDLLLKQPRPDLGDHLIQYCDRENSATYARQPGCRRRWEFRLAKDVCQRSITHPDKVWPLLARWLRPDEAELERAAVYTFHSLVAQQWRSGRLWIAGDAAHQTPPFMGQGMCAGIRDAANLAWKLALAVRGVTDEPLLDSYQTERAPNVTRYVTTAVRLGELINSAEPQAALRLARLSGDGSSRMESLVSELGPGLGSGEGRGRLFGQPIAADGRRMDDLIGYGPTLVADETIPPDVCGMAGMRFLTPREVPGIREDLAHLNARAAVVRPDRYILGAANTPAELAGILASPEVAAMRALAPRLG